MKHLHGLAVAARVPASGDPRPRCPVRCRRRRRQSRRRALNCDLSADARAMARDDGSARTGSCRGRLISRHVPFGVVLEVEQAAAAAEPVRRALVARTRGPTSRCRPPCRRPGRSRWPWVPPRDARGSRRGGVAAGTPGEYTATSARTDADPETTRRPSPARRSIRRWSRSTQSPPAPPCSRSGAPPGGARGDDHRAGADDLWLAGRGGEPGLRAAARPRAPRPRRRRSSRSSTRPSPGSTTGTFGACVRCGKPIAAGTARGAARGPPTASSASGRRPGRRAGDADAPRRPTPDGRRRSVEVTRRHPGRRRSSRAASPSGRPLVAVRTARAAMVPQGRVAPADRRVQAPRRVRDDRVADRGRARARGVITYSSGNHAQGVARAARLLGIPAVVVMPSTRRPSSASAWRPTAPRSSTVGTASDERAARRRASWRPSGG